MSAAGVLAVVREGSEGPGTPADEGRAAWVCCPAGAVASRRTGSAAALVLPGFMVLRGECASGEWYPPSRFPRQARSRVLPVGLWGCGRRGARLPIARVRAGVGSLHPACAGWVDRTGLQACNVGGPFVRDGLPPSLSAGVDLRLSISGLGSAQVSPGLHPKQRQVRTVGFSAGSRW